MRINAAEVSRTVQLGDDLVVELGELLLVDDAEIFEGIPPAEPILNSGAANRKKVERLEALDEPARALRLGQQVSEQRDDTARELALFAFVVEQGLALILRQAIVAFVETDGEIGLLVDPNEDERVS